jgi:putative transposase
LRRFDQPNHCRFLTFSCYHRLPLFNNDRIKHAFIEHLAAVRDACEFQLYGYVVMPEHVHLMIRPKLPQSPVSLVLRRLKGAFSHRVLERWKALRAPVLTRLRDADGLHFWQQGGGYDRNIYSAEEFHEKIGYMHENPVKRGLVGRAIDWPWSSAPWYAGLRDGTLRIDTLN